MHQVLLLGALIWIWTSVLVTPPNRHRLTGRIKKRFLND
ncbi:hypothetical protein SRIMHP_26635 [Streptomyces rimosus subsp. rimosus]|uniref:Uncharacterized protein n=1 Tax=Streptomyces rimosus subsp. rimosus TaxID=132474 RepID=A0ABY3Z871_STRRM|nr:hypothetical protein SRIMR7_29260 [Streptomyces rimosus subsp. rimosus]UTH97700.1 hypothetical protein SRIMHP_26635 [Streptomyces rimosus subsp. rimosus]UTJ15798.1 hypothetical protein SRIMDV3_26535 [Streptomyces rimosus subsp. rimosus]